MIITISDITLGYGSPQIIKLTKELADCYQDDFKILQPAVPNTPILPDHTYSDKIVTIPTREHPFLWLGRWQYFQQCKILIEKYKPSTLIISNYNLMPILDCLDYIPPKIINLVLEDVEQFGDNLAGKAMISRLKSLAHKIDFWIFPEQNRAIHDAELFQISYDKIVVLPNIYEANPTESEVVRIPKILYAGTLNTDVSVACHLIDPSSWKLPLDIFGKSTQENLTAALTQARHANQGLHWHGYVSADVLDTLIPQYAFSLVFWLPNRFALLNAAPNKFFQALAHGVPVITAPHPQCKTYVERYNCGLVMKDWSKEEFIRTAKLGMNLFGTSQYQDMVNGAKRAVSQELNWQTQMKLLMNKLQMKLTS